jgi:hypothetical protein
MAGRHIAAQTDERIGAFIYGLVPADVEPTQDARGLGAPAGRVDVVRHGDVAALVSEIKLDQSIGRPEDLVAYQRLLDGTARVAPVLPVRFGAVLAGPEAVEEFLATYRDDIATALHDLEGQVEYQVRSRYVQRALLAEVLAGNAEAAGLREQIRGMPEETTVDHRIRLGEIVNQAIDSKRAADTGWMVEVLAPIASQTAVRPATHEEDAANVAFLVEAAREAEFKDAVARLSADWEGRATVRLLGPSAPYDFVAPLQPGA